MANNICEYARIVSIPLEIVQSTNHHWAVPYTNNCYFIDIHNLFPLGLFLTGLIYYFTESTNDCVYKRRYYRCPDQGGYAFYNYKIKSIVNQP